MLISHYFSGNFMAYREMWTERRSEADEPFLIFSHDALWTVSNTAWVHPKQTNFCPEKNQPSA